MIMINIDKLVKYAEKLGASEAEITLGAVDKYIFEASRNNLERALSTSTLSIGVRVAVGKKVGAAGGQVTGQKHAERIIEHAVKIARTNNEDPKWPGFNPVVKKAPTPVAVYSEETASITEEEGSDILLKQLSNVKTADPAIIVSEAKLYLTKETSLFANSYGGPLDEQSTGYTYVIELKKKSEGKEGTYIDWKQGVRLDPLELDDITKRAITRVNDAVQASPSEGFKGTLILDPGEAASLLRILLVPAVSAENVQQKRSPLIGKLGEKVLSDKLSILDDPFLPYETGSARFDDEGHPTMKKYIFKDGVLETYLYDHYTASIEGKESTGNGFKRSPHSSPSPSPTNLVIDSIVVKDTITEAVNEITKGLYVVSTIGSWLSNPVSGQINATVTLGYLIEKGEIKKTVKGVAISGNIYEALAGSFLFSAGKRECMFGVCTGALVISDFTIAGH